MASINSNSKVALYWDFENIHAALYDKHHSPRKYKDNCFSPQPPLVNVKIIMEYIASVGEISINRAYCNWQWFAGYKDSFNRYGLDLIQLYPKGGGMKNGSDIRLVLDVLEDINQCSHITHVVIVGSDSDFISLSQKVKQSGRTIIGIGVLGHTNWVWPQCCTEFKYYDTLIKMQEEAGEPISATESELKSSTTTETVLPTAIEIGAPSITPQLQSTGTDNGERADYPRDEENNKTFSLEEAEQLMIRAIKQLMAKRGQKKVLKAQLKITMRRMEPEFDENMFGYQTFNDFVNNFSNIIENHKDNAGGWVQFTETYLKERTGNTGPLILPSKLGL